MENNMQTNSEQNKQKSYVTSDTSFTPDKNTHETPMTDHSLNENEGSREQKQTQSDNVSSQSNRTSDANEGYQPPAAATGIPAMKLKKKTLR